jgi:curved DNA-binding protein CbpA
MVMTLAEAVTILGLSSYQQLSETALKKAYRQKAVETHPDKGGNAEDFIKVRKAYTTLRNYILGGEKNSGQSSQSKQQYKQTGQPNQNQQQAHTTAQWKAAYDTLWIQFQQLQAQNKRLWEITHSHETQISTLIDIFNKGRNKINAFTATFRSKIDQLDQLYEAQEAKLKERHNRKWWQYVVPVSKLTEQEYIQLHNELVKNIQAQEHDMMKTYNKDIQDIYETILKEFYVALS